MSEPIHIRPTAELAERVLLPGDPGRALALAQSLLNSPLMFNHNRGLWGYTGRAGDGKPLTIQSTGMGGPSAAIVISELVDLGAGTLMRVGTCGALEPGLELGDLLVATDAVVADGTSRALGAAARVSPDPELLAALIATGDTRPRTVVSTDLFYDGRPDQERRWMDQGAAAVEMETATLFALADIRRVRAATLLLVTDLLFPARVRIAEDALHDGERRMGETALHALGARAPSGSG